MPKKVASRTYTKRYGYSRGGPPSGRAPNPRNLKKTSKKGAYKPTVKKQFMKRRNPFVENKTRNEREFCDSLDPMRDITIFGNFPDPTNFQDIPVDDAFTLILPAPFYTMNRGLNHNEMIGDSIYAKYLKTKLQFLAPKGAYLIDYPSNVYLIHGYCTAPVNATSLTTPTTDDVTYVDVFNHIRRYVKEYYNERKDTLEFPEKRERHIEFLGKRKLQVNKNEDLPIHGYGGSVGTSTLGALAPINISCTWNLMRKVHYDKGENNADLGDPAVYPMADFNFPNLEKRLPFIIVYQPQFASVPGHPTPDSGHLWKVAHNSQMWYSDS